MSAETLAYRMVAGCLEGEAGDGYRGPSAEEIVDELGSDQRLGAVVFVQLVAMAARALECVGDEQERHPLDVMAELWPKGAAQCRP